MFCIGHKTGTTSLKTALSGLGYRNWDFESIIEHCHPGEGFSERAVQSSLSNCDYIDRNLNMIRRFARALKSRASSHWWRYVANRTPKVFCISMQKTGTTSVGQFFQDFGFKRAGWPACRRGNWRELWYEGDYESLFRSSDFRSANVYEDSPWFYPNFYRVLYHRFPEAKFVLMERDPNEWWTSMKNHCQGDILGLNRIHSKVYRRESEFFELIDEGSITDEMWTSIHDKKKMSLSGHENHYKKVYKIHNKEIKNFFRNKSADVLHVGNLEDPNKWKKLGNFLSINVPSGYECHKNKSK